MTIINLHGILAKEFGSSFCMTLRKAKEVIDAISVNKKNFRHRITELTKQGIHYSIIVDGESIKKVNELDLYKNPKEIDLVPAIMGAGKVVGAILFVVGAVLTAVGFGQIGIPLMIAGIQMMMAPKPPKPEPVEAYISAAKESLLFASKANITQQGIPVPVGYGRLRIGSAVIQASIKSYSMKQVADKALVGDNEDNSVAIASRFA